MENWVFGALVLGTPAGLGTVISYLFYRVRRTRIEEKLNAAHRKHKDMGEVVESLRVKLQSALDSKARAEQGAKALPELERQVTSLEKENLELKEQVAKMKKEREVNDKMGQWLGQAEEHLRETFQTLASQALKSNTDEFIKRTDTQLDHILNQARGDWNFQKTEFQSLVQPLEKTLDALDNQVRELEQKREGSYERLQEHLWQLGQTYEQLKETTTTLTHALKVPGTHGSWGELQLRRVVEMAGMLDRVDFGRQETEDGDCPDMIVHLPNRGILPVDAKTPLQPYLEAMESTDDQLRKVKLDAYLQTMRERIQKLGERRYWQQFERTADIVVMFVPNDACLGFALERDPELLETAMQQRVLLTTPVALLALLKAVAYGWQQHQDAENARQIVLQGKELYKCLITFLSNLGDLGGRLDMATQDYNKAVGSLEIGVLPAARRLREMIVEKMGLPAIVHVVHRAIPPPPSPGLGEEMERKSLSS